MSQNVLKGLGVLLLAVLLVVVGFWLGSASGQVEVVGNLHTSAQGITVSGDGKATATPDLAYITVGVETTASTAREASEQNAQRMAGVVNKAKSLGIAEKDIQTSGVDLTPVYDTKRVTDSNQPPTILGYKAGNRVTLTVRDVTKTGEILDGAVEAGANSVQGVTWDLKDDSKQREEALAAASKTAAAKAKVLAESMGVKLGPIVSMSEEYSSFPVSAVSARTLSVADSTTVSPGELTINARVTITYKID